MTPLDNVFGLIERLDGLERPCREVDRQIALAAFDVSRVRGSKPDGSQDGFGDNLGVLPKGFAFTASIDAAMTLVPERCSVSAQQRRPNEPYWFGLRCHDRHETFDGKHITPAIALCIAALKAKDLT